MGSLGRGVGTGKIAGRPWRERRRAVGDRGGHAGTLRGAQGRAGSGGPLGVQGWATDPSAVGSGSHGPGGGESAGAARSGHARFLLESELHPAGAGPPGPAPSPPAGAGAGVRVGAGVGSWQARRAVGTLGCASRVSAAAASAAPRSPCARWRGVCGRRGGTIATAAQTCPTRCLLAAGAAAAGASYPGIPTRPALFIISSRAGARGGDGCGRWGEGEAADPGAGPCGWERRCAGDWGVGGGAWKPLMGVAGSQTPRPLWGATAPPQPLHADPLRDVALLLRAAPARWLSSGHGAGAWGGGTW